MSEAIVEKQKGISPLWILPLLAICLGGWLLFKSFTDAGIDITVLVEDSTGLAANKTPVMYKGNQVGIVKEILIRSDLKGVDLRIEMNKGSEQYLVEDMTFWVEKVDVKGSRVTGLDTLLSGSYIGVELGVSTKPSRNFTALTHRPPVRENAPGLHLVLDAVTLNSLDFGSGIYHKNIQVGSVQEYKIKDDGTVQINIFIEPEYQHFVKKGTRFWNASGITVSGGITDLKIHIASLAAILQGGIEMETPDSLKDSSPAVNGQIFTLYDNYDELTAVNTPFGLNIVLETNDLGSLNVGSNIYYRGVEVGEITAYKLSPTFQNVLLDATIYDRYAPAVRENTKFWDASGINVSGGIFSGLSVSTESLESLMAGGITMATPENDEMGAKVHDGHFFTLYDEGEEYWSEWSPEITSEQNQPADE